MIVCDEILKRVGGDQALLFELIGILLEEAPNNLKMIHDGITANDSANVRLGCHTLKTSLSYFGAPAAAELANQLETMARSGLLDGASKLNLDLNEMVQAFLTELQQYRGMLSTPNQ